MELQAEGPGWADDVAKAKEVLKVEKVGGELGAGRLREIVGREEEFSKGGCGNPEEDHGDVWRKKTYIAADGKAESKTGREAVAGQREGDDEAGNDKEDFDS